MKSVIHIQNLYPPDNESYINNTFELEYKYE